MYEKRKYPRQDTSLQCYVEQVRNDTNVLQARVVNQSLGGMKVINDYRYDPGETLRISLTSDDYEMNLFGDYYCTGIVRWCEEETGRNAGLYASGVELTSQMYRPNEKDYAYEMA